MDSFQLSVVIPVYNNASKLDKCLSALKQQKQNLISEIIVVDNGSMDDSIIVAENHKAKILHQKKLKSPYPSRNMGIKAARSDYILLVDSNCFATENAVYRGLEFLIQKDLDFVSPKIDFIFSEKPSIYEYLDSLYFVDIEKDIKKGATTAGVIFSKKSIYEKYGYFPEDMRSNGDTLWSRKMTLNGVKLGFAAQSTFLYDAKSKNILLKKCRRVGNGNRILWRKMGQPAWETPLKALWNMRPDSFQSIKQRIKRRGQPWMLNKIMKFWSRRWLMKIHLGLGRLGIK